MAIAPVVPAVPPAGGPPPPGKPFFEQWLGVIASILAVISTALGIYTGYLSSRVSQLSQRLTETNAERDWTSKIVDKFSAIVTSKDMPPEQRIAAIAPLANLVPLVSKQEVRDGLILSIRTQIAVYQEEVKSKSKAQTETLAEQAPTDAVIRQAAAITENVGKPAPASTPKQGQAYNFDIFWCESVGGAENLANRINALKSGMPGPAGRWRVRKLFDATNAKPGYNKRGFIINYNSSDELPLAQKLQELITTDGVLTSALPPVRILPVGTPTTNYLSVFVCPN